MMYFAYICTICGESSDPKCLIAREGLWICPECAKRIKKLIYPDIYDAPTIIEAEGRGNDSKTRT